MNRPSPRGNGVVEISRSDDRIFIGGDPEGLRSLAGLLMWLADVDQDQLPTIPMEKGAMCICTVEFQGSIR